MHPKADAKERIKFQKKIDRYKKQKKVIVYSDESGFEHDMPRRYGYSLKGTPCYGTHDWHAKGRINVIGALSGKNLLTVCLFEGTINADVFYAWVTQDLLPQLPPHSVFVLDNATFHKRSDSREALEQAGHIVEFLPPYSPDLNPIEHKWAELKSLRRSLRCTVQDLFSYL